MEQTDTAGQQETGYVISEDGLKIGYTKFGSGPAVVIVHGSYSVKEHWFQFAGLLAETNTVYVYDRRGRGQSADNDKSFSFQKEIDDLEAMLILAGAGVSIIGHSYGGGITLNYIIQTGFKGRVIFYEPMNGILRQVSQGLLPQLKVLVAEEKLDKATELTQTKIVGFEPAEVEATKASPSWNAFTQMTAIFIREVEALDNLRPAEAETDKIKAKAFLLLGTETPHILRTTTVAVAARVRGITMYPISNQGHLAHLFDPEQLKALVLQSLNQN